MVHNCNDTWRKDMKLLLEKKEQLPLSVYADQMEAIMLQKLEQSPCYTSTSIVDKIIQQLPNVNILVLEPNLKFTFSKVDDSALKKFFNGNITGRFLQEVVHGKQNHFQFDRVRSVFQKKEFSYHKQFGSKIFSVTQVPLIDADNNVTHALITLSDITEAKMAEIELFDKDKQYRQLLENLRQVVFQTDTAGNFLFLSNAWEDFSSMLAIESIGCSMWSYISEEEVDTFKTEVENVLNTEVNFIRYEVHFIFGDKTKEAEINLRANFNTQQKLIGFSGTIYDLSERNRHIAEKEESEKKYKSTLELLPDMLLVQNDEGVYIDAYVPDRSIAIKPPEYFLGKKMDAVLPKWLADSFFELMGDARSTKKVQYIEYSISLNDETHHFEARLICQNEKQYLTVIRDITDRKRVEFKLVENEKRLDLAFTANEDGIWDWDVKRNTIFYSERYASMLGYAKEELSSDVKEWEEMLHAQDRVSTVNELKKYLANAHTNSSIKLEYRIRCKDNTYKWILARGKVTQRDSEGESVRFIGTTTDISNSKHLELGLKQLNATKDKFFSIISHDLRSPYNTLLGFTELLAENYDDLSDRKRKEYVQYIHRISSSSFTLLENLLTWSRAQRGMITYTPQQLLLSEVVEHQLSSFVFRAKQKEVEIVNLISDELQVFADIDMLASILRNLFSNALKFTGQGKQIVITAKFETEQMRVEVKDQGIGIGESDVKRLFRLDENFTTYGTENEKGSGLGLVLCKDFVAQQGGEIGLESQLGKGSTFWFTLPISKTSLE